ncbi:MAG TPA: histidine kinase [Bauldia sp.]|nr:histidine kinase [Bauldia sp.]
MPSLVRFLVGVVVVAALLAAGAVYLAYFVKPNTREMTIKIPATRLQQP